MLTIQLMLIVIAANCAPVIACKLLGDRCNAPVDAGIHLADGYPLFGGSKTWRGLVSAIILSGFTALLLGWSAQIGIAMGAAAMLGDLLSSFVKRRLGKVTSSRALVFDQLPESLLPLLLGSYLFDYGWELAVLLSGLFILFALVISPVLYRLEIRKRPY